MIYFGPSASADVAAVWGGITGTLSDQTDLQTALDARALLTTNTFTGRQVLSVNGAVSASPLQLTGSILTGGSGTTNFPNVLIQPTGATAATDWSTSGTAFGVNLNVDAGNFADWKVDGVSRFKVTAGGIATLTEINIGNGGFAIYNNGNAVTLYNSGNIFGASTTGLKIKSDKRIEFSDGDMSGTADAFLERVAAGVVKATALAGTTQALSGAGAVNVTTFTTKLTSTGVAEALTLADGTDGQFKSIIHDVDGGSMVLTPTTAVGFTTITFTNVGETALLQFVTTRGWAIISLRGAVAA